MRPPGGSKGSSRSYTLRGTAPAAWELAVVPPARRSWRSRRESFTLHHQDPAVESRTARSLDLVSLPEAFFSRDRRVQLVWPRRELAHFAAVVLVATLCAALAAWGPALWLRTAALAGCVLGVVYYIAWMHSVLRFTRT